MDSASQRATPPHPYKDCPHCHAGPSNLVAQWQPDGWYELLCAVCTRTWATWRPGMAEWDPYRPITPGVVYLPIVPLVPIKDGPRKLPEAA